MLWYLSKDYKLWLVYDWTNLNEALDWQEALDFKKNNPEFSVYKLEWLYGKDYEFKFPDSKVDPTEEDWWKNITTIWYETILDLSNLWYINDYTLWAHKLLTSTYDIYVKKLMWWEELYQLKKKTAISNKWTLWMDWELIMLKEMVMGYSQPDEIQYRPTKTSEVKKFKVWQDYTFDFKGQSITIKDNYTAAIRYQMLHKALEEWNSNPRYRNHQRNNLLQWWQADAMKRMGRKTVMLVPRRAWKTVVMTLEILKEMLSYNYKKATRPRTVIFLSKDFDAVGQVMDYVKSLINEFDWMRWMFKYREADHILSLETFNEKWERKVIAQCKFYSALWKLPAVWDAADAVLIDEAMLVPTRIKDKIMAIVNHEWARFLAVSTFYSEDEDGVDRLYYRPVEMCNKFEKESSKIIDIDKHILDLAQSNELPDECAGLRYTIDDVEVIVNKEVAKKELEDKPANYMRELYCRLSEEKKVFNYKPYIRQVRYSNVPYPCFITGEAEWNKIIKPKFKRTMLAYDPAQTGDISGLLASGYDEERKKVVIFKERWLNYKDKSSYIPQAVEIKKAMEDLARYNCPILKCIDSTHTAVVDVMWWQWIYFQYLYFWVWGNNIKKWSRPSERRVPKKMMVEAAQTMFDNGLVEIWDSECKELIEQLGSFVEFKNDYTNTSKYQWANWIHDDYVACLLMTLRTYWNHLWLSHNNFQIDSFTEYAMTKDQQSDPLWLLTGDNEPQIRYESISNEFWY